MTRFARPVMYHTTLNVIPVFRRADHVPFLQRGGWKTSSSPIFIRTSSTESDNSCARIRLRSERRAGGFGGGENAKDTSARSITSDSAGAEIHVLAVDGAAVLAGDFQIDNPSAPGLITASMRTVRHARVRTRS